MVGDAKGTIRDLTPVEAQVIADLLGAGLESEEDRIRASGYARSGYQESKRRIYARGWVEDRYVLSPAYVGVPHLSFLLARPFLDRMGEVVTKLSGEAGTVLLWSGAQAILAVVFHPTSKDRGRFRERVKAGEFGSEASATTVDATVPTVPVYFDFEGAWRHFTGTAAARRYPRPLPLPAGQLLRRRPSRFASSPALLSLLSRPFSSESRERAQHLLGPARLPRSQRRILAQGGVVWRTFPTLSRLPGFEGSRLASLALVRGRLRQGRELQPFYMDLVARCGVFPFLLVSDGDQVLMGGLAFGPEAGATVRPNSRPRSSVMATVQEHVQDVEVLREPTSGIQEHVSHRYDRILQVAQGGGAG